MGLFDDLVATETSPAKPGLFDDLTGERPGLFDDLVTPSPLDIIREQAGKPITGDAGVDAHTALAREHLHQLGDELAPESPAEKAFAAGRMRGLSILPDVETAPRMPLAPAKLGALEVPASVTDRNAPQVEKSTAKPFSIEYDELPGGIRIPKPLTGDVPDSTKLIHADMTRRGFAEAKRLSDEARKHLADGNPLNKALMGGVMPADKVVGDSPTAVAAMMTQNPIARALDEAMLDVIKPFVSPETHAEAKSNLKLAQYVRPKNIGEELAGGAAQLLPDFAAMEAGGMFVPGVGAGAAVPRMGRILRGAATGLGLGATKEGAKALMGEPTDWGQPLKDALAFGAGGGMNRYVGKIGKVLNPALQAVAMGGANILTGGKPPSVEDLKKMPVDYLLFLGMEAFGQGSTPFGKDVVYKPEQKVEQFWDERKSQWVNGSDPDRQQRTITVPAVTGEHVRDAFWADLVDAGLTGREADKALWVVESKINSGDYPGAMKLFRGIKDAAGMKGKAEPAKPQEQTAKPQSSAAKAITSGSGPVVEPPPKVTTVPPSVAQNTRNTLFTLGRMAAENSDRGRAAKDALMGMVDAEDLQTVMAAGLEQGTAPETKRQYWTRMMENINQLPAVDASLSPVEQERLMSNRAQARRIAQRELDDLGPDKDTGNAPPPPPPEEDGGLKTGDGRPKEPTPPAPSTLDTPPSTASKTPPGLPRSERGDAGTKTLTTDETPKGEAESGDGVEIKGSPKEAVSGLPSTERGQPSAVSQTTRKKPTISLPPLLEEIISHGGIMSKSEAKKRGRLDRNASSYDDVPHLAHPWHNSIYSNGRGGRGGLMPDELATTLAGTYGLPSDATPSDLWAAIDKASRSHVRELGAERREIGRMREEESRAPRAITDAESLAQALARYGLSTADGHTPLSLKDARKLSSFLERVAQNKKVSLDQIFERVVKLTKSEAADVLDHPDAGHAEGALYTHPDTLRATMYLMDNANVSTVVHEFWHGFEPHLNAAEVDVLWKNFQRSARLVMKATKALPSWAKGTVKDVRELERVVANDQDGKNHLAFKEWGARAWETYLREGRAPTKEVAGIFAKLKAWLLKIYRSVKEGGSLDVRLNKETRALFDRLVKGEEAQTITKPNRPEGERLTQQGAEDGSPKIDQDLPPSEETKSIERTLPPGQATGNEVTTTAPPATAKATAESGAGVSIESNVATATAEVKTGPAPGAYEKQVYATAKKTQTAPDAAPSEKAKATKTIQRLERMYPGIKEVAERPETQDLRPKTTEESSETGIVDFGEKLGGARKDQVASADKTISDADLATLSFSDIWPKNELAAIENGDLAALATSLRSIIPAKPRKGYKVQRWVEQVKLVRTLMQYANEHGFDAVMAKMNEGEYQRTLGGFREKVNLLRQLPRTDWDRIGRVENYPDAYRYEKDADGNSKQIPTPFATAEVDGRSVSAPGLDALREKVSERLGVESESASMQFEIRSPRRGGSAFINKKGDPLYRKLKEFTGDDAVAQAKAFLKQSRSDLVAAWEDFKKTDNVKETDLRRDTNRPRTAKDYRQGKDVTPEMFQDAFGFRGVEFGNWVSQGANQRERQGMLNEAFDALHDLADIVGVPLKALSLNGELGLGFGSRGHGWAAAHYEPDKIVINLTKTRGAGSLAHEWFHALDHYFQRQRKGQKSSVAHGGDMITYQPEPYYEHGPTGRRLSATRFQQVRVNDPSEWTRIEGVRPEVEQAFTDLVKALNDVPMKERSDLIDAGKSGGYWSRVIERAARSFENYVIAEMMKQGYHNDYLANVVTIEKFARDANRYPYLLDSEIKPVAEAFDKLFDTIQTRETDKGVAMYQREEEPTDWEKREQLRTMEPVKVDSSPVWDGKNLAFLRTKARALYKTLKEAVNVATGRKVQLVMEGFKEMKQHSADARTLRIVPALRELIGEAIPVITEKEPDAIKRQRGIVQWHHYAVKADLDGEPVYVMLKAFERKDGALYLDVFHDAQVTTSDQMQKDPTERHSETNPAQTQSGLSEDKLYQWWHNVKPPEPERSSIEGQFAEKSNLPEKQDQVTPEILKGAGFADEAAARAEYEKSGLHDVKESFEEFIQRIFCTGLKGRNNFTIK